MTETLEDAERLSLAAIFADEDVARRYHTRAPYTPDLFTVLLSKTPGRRRALDLGCGPGKIARVLAEHFEAVVALDPSVPMIAAGEAADGGQHPNVRRLRLAERGHHQRYRPAPPGLRRGPAGRLDLFQARLDLDRRGHLTYAPAPAQPQKAPPW